MVGVDTPSTRLVAHEANATNLPDALIEGESLFPSPWTPALDTLTRVVSPGTAFPGVTVIETVATLESTVPSFALYVKLSGPL